MDNGQVKIQDMLIEVNFGTKDQSKLTFISLNMLKALQNELILLLHIYKDIFT